VAALQITTLRTTIPFVDSVLNPEAAGGGSDTELVESAVARGPRSIKHRGRAVTAEDFEQLAREASQAVARVKCLPTFDDKGAYKTNWVTVIIVPGTADARPTPSPQLRYKVEQYLRERAASTAAFLKQVKVSGPAYVEVTVTADIYPQTIDLAPQVEADATAALEGFLHPLTGGYGQTGWEFGRLPCLSDFYSLLEAVAGMDHIENLRMILRAVTPSGAEAGEQGPRVVTEDRPLDVEVPIYTLVYSGEHKFDVKALR
jgi:predicted phage baseplate assembly protein